MKLFEHQAVVEDELFAGWEAGLDVQAAVMSTGAGKTVLASSVTDRWEDGQVCLVAHRKELVGQIATTLAKWGVPHNIFAPKDVVKMIVRKQMREVGESFYDPSAPVVVASEGTIRSRDLGPWADQVGLWILDEAHHLLKDNCFGKAVEKFKNAKGLMLTATPCRADGKGLGRHADGLCDRIVEGPNMRWLIDNKFLCDYKIYAPKTKNLHLDQVEVAADGDYKKKQLEVAVGASSIVGDVVREYLKLAKGKRGITFTTSVQKATEIAAEFNRNGVPAEVVHSGTKASVREEAINAFADGRVLQLVNVDLFGEGFDVPAVEVVSMARPTKSYCVYAQQFGRALRVIEGKEYAIIIDHVNNVIEHRGPPDVPRAWSLDGKQKRPKKVADDVIPMTTCDECTRPYEKVLTACPYCGQVPEPVGRSEPEQVDGDLVQLSPDVIQEMMKRAEAAVRAKKAPAHLSQGIQHKNDMLQKKRIEAQYALRASINLWLGYKREEGRNQREAQKLFFYTYGIDVLSAQGIDTTADIVKLANKINDDIGREHLLYAARMN